MNPRSISLPAVCWLLVSLLTLSVAAPNANAADRRHGNAIEFADPGNAEVITNMQKLNTRRDGLKLLEEDLERPLQGFVPRSSMDGVPAELPRSPTPPAINSKKVKELLEKQKNWVLLSPEDLFDNPSAESFLNLPEIGPDGREKKTLSATEAFYERMNRRSAERARMRETGLFGQPKSGTDDYRDGFNRRPDEKLPGELGARANDLRNMIKSDWDGTKAAPEVSDSMTRDMFNLDNKPDAGEERNKERKTMMEEYRHMLGMPTTASELSAQTLYPQPASPFATPGFAEAPKAVAKPAAAEPAANPFSLPTLPSLFPENKEQAAFTIPGAPKPPPPPPPKSITPSGPITEFPRRKF